MTGSRHAKNSTRQLNQGEVFEQILSRLGFTKTAEVNKWRENYHLENASFCAGSR